MPALARRTSSPSASHRHHAHQTHQVHCLYCFDVLASHLQRSRCPEPEFPTDTSYPLFVTWNKANQRGQLDLRGCIGEERAVLLPRTPTSA